jgi:hypothetical protein
MYIAKQNNYDIVEKFHRIKIKAKCKENYKKPLTKRDYKYIYDFTLNAKQVHSKIKRPFTTIYTLRSRYKQTDEFLNEEEIIGIKYKPKLTKKEKIEYWCDRFKDFFSKEMENDNNTR